MPILVVTCREKNPKTTQDEVLVSHGVDMVTGRNVVLPPILLKEAIREWRLRKDSDYDEYIMD